MVNKQYGADKSHEIWTTVSKILDDDELTMGVMTTLLKGGFAGREFTVKRWVDNESTTARGGQKVKAIKTLRKWTRCGLKEAKDVVEAAKIGTSANMELAKQFNEHGDEVDIEYDKFEVDMISVGLTVEME